MTRAADRRVRRSVATNFTFVLVEHFKESTIQGIFGVVPAVAAQGREIVKDMKSPITFVKHTDMMGCYIPKVKDVVCKSDSSYSP